MFEIKDLSKQYGTEFALQNVTMNVGKGMNFIVGASGSGKTTLLKILCGMEQNFEGSVCYYGKDISGFSAKEKSALYHGTFGFVWQDFHLLEEATVMENILLPEYLQAGKNNVSANQILKQLKIQELKDKKVKLLSGGQKQRVAIARELMKNPQVIFCDEPTSALDAKTAKATIEILRSLSKSKTIIVVTHDTSLITESDVVFELDKGELVSSAKNEIKNSGSIKMPETPKLSLKNAFQLATVSAKNKIGRFAVSVVSLMLAATLLLTTFSGAIGESGQSEFDALLETYGENILNIDIIGSFISASGASGEDEDKPSADVDQDLSGLYEKYQNDERVEYIISIQPFENIQLTVEGEEYSVEKTGNSPVLTKLMSGSIPNDDKFQVVMPVNLVKNMGYTEETILGKEIDFSATIFQWINNQPIEKPVQMKAVVCGVADNTVVYEYEGQNYSFPVDDSFFFNRAATMEMRRQAGIEGESANFSIRAKSPEALISLKDEFNRNGIVPLGQFELVEDMVRLNQQTVEQSGSASAVVGVLAAVMVVVIFAMTSFLRKREYAIYRVSGYNNGHFVKISVAETILAGAAAAVLLLALSPILNMATTKMFGASILSAGRLAAGELMVLGVTFIAFAAGIPGFMMADVSAMLNEGAKS